MWKHSDCGGAAAVASVACILSFLRHFFGFLWPLRFSLPKSFRVLHEKRQKDIHFGLWLLYMYMRIAWIQQWIFCVGKAVRCVERRWGKVTSFQDYDVLNGFRCERQQAEFDSIARCGWNNEMLFWIMNWNVDCYRWAMPLPQPPPLMLMLQFSSDFLPLTCEHANHF